MFATRLSIRRAGPELTEEKNTSNAEPFSSKTIYPTPLVESVFPRRRSAKPVASTRRATRLRAVGLWYWLGAALGLGVALGVAIGAVLAPYRGAALLSAVLAALGGYALAAVFLLGPVAALAGAAGGIAGGCCSAELARRTLRRGGTRGATAILLFGAALVVAALAFVPALGYIETVLTGILAWRLGRGGGDRFAGLRSLARD